MADETITATPVAEAPKLRIFKVAGATIREDANTTGLSIQEMRTRLAYQFPEIANATHRTSKNAAGEEVIEFLPVAGHKG
mgnify:CR=1 FL=1